MNKDPNAIVPDYLPQLRAAVKSDPRDQKSIAIAAKIHPVNLSQFVSGKVRLGILAHQRLSDALGFKIELVAKGAA